jgi:hypothetical protein
MGSLTNLVPISHLPQEDYFISFRGDLLNWNMALHHWLVVESTKSNSHMKITRTHTGGIAPCQR